MKNKNLVLGIVGVVGVLFIALIFGYNKSETKKIEQKFTNINEAPYVRDHSIRFGKNGENVTIVEFMDPECESCAIFHPIVKKVLEENYEDVQLVVRYMPNHKNAPNVVKILEAARVQGKYQETLRIVFDTLGIWANHNNPRPELLWEHLPKVEGLDIEKLKKDINNPAFEKIIKLDMEDAKALGLTGTPTLFVNGQKLETLSYEALNTLVLLEIVKQEK